MAPIKIKNARTFEDAQGSIVVLALVLLVLVSLFGIATMDSSNLEAMIARNDYDNRVNFNLAEGALRETGQRIENASTFNLQDTSYTTFDWLQNAGSTDLTDPDAWDEGGSPPNCVVAASDPGGITRLAAEYIGISILSPMGMFEPKLHEYGIYGLVSSNRGEAHLTAGYRKKY